LELLDVYADRVRQGEVTAPVDEALLDSVRAKLAAWDHHLTSLEH